MEGGISKKQKRTLFSQNEPNERLHQAQASSGASTTRNNSVAECGRLGRSKGGQAESDRLETKDPDTILVKRKTRGAFLEKGVSFGLLDMAAPEDGRAPTESLRIKERPHLRIVRSYSIQSDP